jgi:hypothetical protein
MVQLSVGLDQEESGGATQVVKGSQDISAPWYYHKKRLLRVPAEAVARDCTRCPDPDLRQELSRAITQWQAENDSVDRGQGKLSGGTTDVNDLFCDTHDPIYFSGNKREDIVCRPGAVRISNVGLIHGTRGESPRLHRTALLFYSKISDDGETLETLELHDNEKVSDIFKYHRHSLPPSFTASGMMASATGKKHDKPFPSIHVDLGSVSYISDALLGHLPWGQMQVLEELRQLLSPDDSTALRYIKEKMKLAIVQFRRFEIARYPKDSFYISEGYGVSGTKEVSASRPRTRKRARISGLSVPFPLNSGLA